MWRKLKAIKDKFIAWLMKDLYNLYGVWYIATLCFVWSVRFLDEEYLENFWVQFITFAPIGFIPSLLMVCVVILPIYHFMAKFITKCFIDSILLFYFLYFFFYNYDENNYIQACCIFQTCIIYYFFVYIETYYDNVDNDNKDNEKKFDEFYNDDIVQINKNEHELEFMQDLDFDIEKLQPISEIELNKEYETGISTSKEMNKILECIQLNEYIKWLQTQADYKDFDNWCSKLLDNKFFTLDMIFYKIALGLFYGFSFSSIQNVISNIYQIFHEYNLGKKDDVNLVSLEVVEFLILAYTYIEDDD